MSMPLNDIEGHFCCLQNLLTYCVARSLSVCFVLKSLTAGYQLGT